MKRRTKGGKKTGLKMEIYLPAGQKRERDCAETRLSLSRTRQLCNISSSSRCDGVICEHVSAFISTAVFLPVWDGLLVIRCSFM